MADDTDKTNEDHLFSEEYAREMREANAIDHENSLGRAWQEHIAGEPGHSFLSSEEQDAAADRFFKREIEAGRLSSFMVRPEQKIEFAETRDDAIASLKQMSQGPRDLDVDLPSMSKKGAER